MLRAIFLILTICFVASSVRAESSDESFQSALNLMKQTNFRDAERIFSQLAEKNPENGLIWFNLGTASFNANHLDLAIRSFQKVIKLQSPLTPAALLCLAKCLRRQKQWSEAMHRLALASKLDSEGQLGRSLDSEREELAKALRTEGIEQLNAGDGESALRLLQLSLENRKQPETIYAQALAFTLLERLDEARESFRIVLRESNNSQMEEEAREFIERLESGFGYRNYWLTGELTGGYDSNVFFAGDSRSATATPAAQMAVGAGIRLFKAEEFYGRLAYRFSWLENFGEILGRYISQNLRGQIFYENSGWSIGFVPSLTYQWIGTEPYLLKGSAGFSAQKNSRSWGIGAQYEYSRNYSQQSSYSYLNGELHWAEAHIDYWTSEVDFRIYYAALSEGIQDLVSGSTTLPLRDLAHGPGARLNWNPSPGWDISVSSSLLFRHYLNPGKPGNVVRNDNQISSYFRVSRKVSQDVAILASAGVILNTSTLDASSAISDRNYSQWLTLAGVSWNAIH